MPTSLENTKPKPKNHLSRGGAMKSAVLWTTVGMVVSYALIVTVVAFLPGPF